MLLNVKLNNKYTVTKKILHYSLLSELSELEYVWFFASHVKFKRQNHANFSTVKNLFSLL